MNDDLQKFKDALSKAATGMTKGEAHNAGICVRCKLSPIFYSYLGRKEYEISGLCEYCFDDVANPMTICCNKHLQDCECDIPKFPEKEVISRLLPVFKERTFEEWLKKR